MAVPISSFKLRLRDARLRVVPAKNEDGCAFASPGVDLIGDEARAAFALSAPIFAWFEEREPGVVFRSLSFDLTTGRVLGTVEVREPEPAREPEAARAPAVRVVRVYAPESREVFERAAPLIAYLGIAAAAKLRARGQRGL